MALEESLVDRTRNVLEKLKVGLPYEEQIKFVQNKRVLIIQKLRAIVP